MSKGEILRGFVTERLAAASQEILAVVDRIVAGYEEEALGLKQEIDQQRRELKALLQPQVNLNKPGVQSSRSFSPVEEEEGKDKEHPENLADSTEQTPTRIQNKRRRPGRPQSHVFLWIRILEDSHIQVLSNSVLKKCPMLKLECPRGLQEADFLQLLKSTFPQLSADNQRFDILTSDKKRRLQPLKLKTVTPEEIHSNLSCTGWEKSTIYIRLKELQEETHQSKDTNSEASQSSSVRLICDEKRLQTSSHVQEGLFLSSSSTSQQEMETEEADGADHRTSDPSVAGSAAESKGDGSDDMEKEQSEEENDSEDNWKLDKMADKLKERDSGRQSKMTEKKKGRRSGVKATKTKTVDKEVALFCKVCGALHQSEVAFVKHAWSHVDDPGRLCGVCGELSESVEALKAHLDCEHKTEGCHVCGKSFVSILSLSEHVAAHSGDKLYQCDVCLDESTLKMSLENHQKLHKEKKLHRCRTCHKTFELKEQLKVHSRTHSNKKTHLCGVCGKSLSDHSSLYRHKMTHSGERPHGCQVCGRRFKLLGTLKQHEKIHTNRERSYLCDVCCKMFLTSKQLQIHMRRHTNEKPYHCGECGKGFSTKGPLTIHMRVHTGETPYSCPDCGWSFKRKSNLDNHVKIHSGHKPFVCGICGKACARKTYLTVHMRTHNGERPYKCDKCDKAFTQSHCLKTHMKSHLGTEAAT